MTTTRIKNGISLVTLTIYESNPNANSKCNFLTERLCFYHKSMTNANTLEMNYKFIEEGVLRLGIR